VSVEIDRLSCRGHAGYGLSDVSLSVLKGAGCLVAGPNGSGKSLLLATLAGLVRPTAGRVELDGQDLFRHTNRARRAVGYAPQLPAAFAGLTVDEHLGFLARCHGVAGRERQEAAATMLDVVGLADVAKMEAALLTPGQQRRLALAGALVHNPPVLLLDTPFAGLDTATREEMIEVVREIRGMGTTLLLVADRPLEAASLCDVAIGLEGGEIRWQGAAAELPSEYGGLTAREPIPALFEVLAC
jgi:ABC-2 type transport system ATP-binding protein